MSNQPPPFVPEPIDTVWSARQRILINLFSALFNKGFNFLAMGIFLPRSLGVVQYGLLMSLWRMAEATRGFLILGVDQAFFVEAARRIRSGVANRLFVVVLAGQFLVLISLALVAGGLDLETRWLHGQSATVYGLVILTEWLMAASSLATRFGDAKARIGSGHAILLVVGGLRAVLLAGFFLEGRLTIVVYLGVTAATSLVITLAALIALRRISPACFQVDPDHQPWAVARYFFDTARSFAVISSLGFVNNMILSWYLTEASGPEQQAYYNLAFQLLNVISLLTGSMINVFQREISWSLAHNDRDRVFTLFSRSCRLSMVLAALVAHVTAFNADLIIHFMVGPSFAAGAPVLACLIFSGIFMGPVDLATSMYLVFGKISAYRNRYTLSLILCIVMYLIFVNPRDAWLPGLHMGAMGIALAMVISSVLVMYIQLGYFMHEHPSLRGEIRVTLLVTTLGFGMLHGLASLTAVFVFAGGVWWRILASVVFLLLCGAMLWYWPGLAGFSRSDRKYLRQKPTPDKAQP